MLQRDAWLASDGWQLTLVLCAARLRCAQCTHFIQPWDQLFSSVKAKLKQLYTHAQSVAYTRGLAGTQPRSETITLVDAAVQHSVGFSRTPLSRAFKKTGLFPASLPVMIAAAEAALSTRKKKRFMGAWKPRKLTPAKLQSDVERALASQDPVYMLADSWLTLEEVEAHMEEHPIEAGGPRPRGRPPARG